MAIASQQVFLQKELPVLNAHVVIVYTSWNATIVGALQQSALQFFEQYAGNIQVTSIEVPGAVEIPFAIQHHYANSAIKADAYIAFGCVIQGDTPHFDYVCQSVTQGITLLNTQQQSPVIFGVLTVLNEQQAKDRIKGGIVGDKGQEAAVTAIRMIAILKQA